MSDAEERLRAAEERIAELEQEVARKKELIASMSSLLQQTEESCEDLKKANEAMQDRLDHMFQGPAMSSIDEEDENEEEDDEDIEGKVLRFLHNACPEGNKALQRSKMRALVVNVLACFHHTEPSPPPIASAAQVAFRAAQQLFQQLQGQAAPTDNFPLQWLLGVFPLTGQLSDDSVWLPLHLFLALRPAASALPSYLQELDLLLEEFGPAAFAEEVSPLSIAVAKRSPLLEVVERIVAYRPQCLQTEDEDGCTALMHACAHNETEEVAAYLLQRRPQGLDQEDNFGCSAVHYAAFCGQPCMVEHLVSADARCAQKVEGNGALPLHDAVQNTRGCAEQLEIVSILLQAYPQAVYKADDYGALPLHKAAKSAGIEVFTAVHAVFPQALFVEDSEGLLPLHYYSQRTDKDLHLDLVQFILTHNPRCDVLSDKEVAKLVKAHAPPPAPPTKRKAAAAPATGPVVGHGHGHGHGHGAGGVGSRRKSCVQAKRMSVHGQYRK